MCCAEGCLYAGSAGGPNSLADVREASPQLTSLTRLTRHCFDDAGRRRFSLCGSESGQQLGFVGSSGKWLEELLEFGEHPVCAGCRRFWAELVLLGRILDGT